MLSGLYPIRSGDFMVIPLYWLSCYSLIVNDLIVKTVKLSDQIPAPASVLCSCSADLIQVSSVYLC